MQQRTRDGLVYLAVGLSIAALVVADFVYREIHGQKMWVPTRFASRLVASAALLGYFVARETRRAGATLSQRLSCVLLAIILNTVLCFVFRQAVAQLSVWSFAAFAAIEAFFVVQLLLYVVRYLRP